MTMEPHLSTELGLSLPQAGVQLRPGQEGGSARQLAERGRLPSGGGGVLGVAVW